MAKKDKKSKVDSTRKAVKTKAKVVSAKSAVKKPAPKPKAASSPAKTKPVPKPAPVKAKPVAKPVVAVKPPAPVIKSTLPKPFVDKQKQRLADLRDHILDQMHGVAQDTLRVKAEGSEASAFGMHQADAGSDAYDKDFALSLLSQEQDALYEIEEALKRVESKTYGVCEMSGKPIPRLRLEAIPHARFTVECQAQLERENRGRRRWDTTPQFMDSAESLVDEDDDGAEEDDRRKEKD
jgi:RNA polymerase-binding transcription factor DksA